MIFKFVQNTSKSSIISKHCFFGSAITWLKIIQTLQVGGVLESSRPPLDYGHRANWNWCSLGWEMDENESAILIGANCKALLMVWKFYKALSTKWRLSLNILKTFVNNFVDTSHARGPRVRPAWARDTRRARTTPTTSAGSATRGTRAFPGTSLWGTWRKTFNGSEATSKVPVEVL